LKNVIISILPTNTAAFAAKEIESNSTMKKIISIAIRVATLLIAALFIFSGFVKGIDPLGTTYKLVDYFEAFHLTFLNPIATPLSILLSSAEMLIGLALLFKVRVKLAAWAAFIFMAFFTVLTFILALYNPVSDCGCFGDALILTNWETFFKNLIFLPITYLIFWQRNAIKERFKRTINSWITVGILALAAIMVSIISLAYLPPIDFRPFRVGVNLKEAMDTPQGAPTDIYKTTLVYEKDGVKKTFDESNYPWKDTTWKFVDSKSVLVKKGYTPSIISFSLLDENGTDVSDLVVNGTGYTFLLVAPKLENANLSRIKYLRYLDGYCLANGHKFLVTTSSDWDKIKSFEEQMELPVTVTQGDEVLLKTIVRSNPGLLLIYNGTIIGKWSWRTMPVFHSSNQNFLSFCLKQNQSMLARRMVVSLILLLALGYMFTLYLKKKKKKKRSKSEAIRK